MWSTENDVNKAYRRAGYLRSSQVSVRAALAPPRVWIRITAFNLQPAHGRVEGTTQPLT